MTITLKDVLDARERICGTIRKTPLKRSSSLGAIADCQFYIKPECFQKTGAFKIRGAANKILSLSKEELARGVITASSGNHGQAAAYAAKIAGAKAVVVMPENGSPAKAASIRAYGADLRMCGRTSDERMALAAHLKEEMNLTMVHPYDDPLVMAGQGTIGLEILDGLPDADAVLVPTGGGGLMSGILTAIKEQKPSVKIYGVEPERANSTTMSLEAGMRVRREVNDSIADGMLTSIPGELTFPVLMKYLDGMISVTESDITRAMRLILERCKMMTEPTGAVTSAALLSGKFPAELRGKKIVAVASGGNVAIDSLVKFLA